MKTFGLIRILVPLLGVVASLRADPGALVITASNATANQLLVYSVSGKLLQAVPTQGTGGASGNAGGIEANGSMVAVVNFGSNNVSIFQLEGNGFHMQQLVPTASSPLSVAFGADHLYVLGATEVESHALYGLHVNPNPDGIVPLLIADGSAAQVGVLPTQLIITEKTGAIETVNLLAGGVIAGSATLVKNIPANPLAPFGLVTRGSDAYVTIAHSNLITLVRGDSVVTVTGSGTQNAPCWLTLVGPFLYSSNSPSMTLSRYVVFGAKLLQDLAVAAVFDGDPTDIASGDGLVAVIDGNGPVSHLSIFQVDLDGNLALQAFDIITGAANGVAVIPIGL